MPGSKNLVMQVVHLSACVFHGIVLHLPSTAAAAAAAASALAATLRHDGPTSKRRRQCHRGVCVRALTKFWSRMSLII